MKLPDFKEHSGLNALRKKIGAKLNFMYRPENNPIWDLGVAKLLDKLEVGNLDLNDITVSTENLLEYRGNKVLVYQKHQLERGMRGTHQFHFYNCVTIKKAREENKYTGKYVANRGAQFRGDVESYGKTIQKHIKINLYVCKNCLKQSNYYSYAEVDYNKKSFIYKNFSLKEYFEAVD